MILVILLTIFSWKRNVLSKKIVIHILGGLAISLFCIYGLFTFYFVRHSLRFQSYIESKQIEFEANQDDYIPLITTLFDEAENRNVRTDIDNQYNDLLGYTMNNEDRREPSYFIRLKEGKIQKLFQSGELKNETVDTEGERTVVAMLEGRVSTKQFPQYTCCGPDDIYPELPFFRLILPDRTYLGDFYSELEMIYLIKDKQEEILGAKVKLYAD